MIKLCLICKKLINKNECIRSSPILCTRIQPFQRVSKIPDRYKSVLLADLHVVKQSKFKEYVGSFKGNEITNIYIHGECTGTGKTTSAVALANEFVVTYLIKRLQGNVVENSYPIYFLDANEWQTLYNAFNRPNVAERTAKITSNEYYDRMEIASKAELLIIDDVGVRASTEGFRGDIHKLINDRISNKSITVFTSNLPIEDMASIYDKRLYDRLREDCLVVSYEEFTKSERGLG